MALMAYGLPINLASLRCRRRELVIKKFLIGLSIAALSVLAASCQNAAESNVNANANANTGQTVSTTGPDNSEITTTTDSNGDKTETRTFKSNPRVSKVVVTSRGGTRTVKVYSPSGEEKDVNEPPDVLHATGDAIADGAGWVKDKSITAADKTKEGAKTVADKTVDTSKKVADKTVDTSKTVANKTKQGAKKVGDKTVDTTKTVVDETKEGVKKAGKTIKKIIPPQ
jgi:hypothetical protein